MEAKYKSVQNKNYYLAKRIKLAKVENAFLKEKLAEACDKFKIDEDTKRKLNALLSDDVLGILNKRQLEKTKSYDPELRKFALTLHFYSPKADWMIDFLFLSSLKIY